MVGSSGAPTAGREVKALPSMGICSLAIDRSNSAVLYATTTGDGKAFKSTNGGDTWDEIRFGFPRTGGCGLIVDPADPTILYASNYAKPTPEMRKSTDAVRLGSRTPRITGYSVVSGKRVRC
jgi:hypothetical protein